MNNFPLELELRKLGLTEKEVRIYLAGLELGPDSVQNIAKAAKLTRPTAHEIIKKLEEKKLYAELKGNKKKVFMAQSPETLLGIIRTQKREIDEKEREFIRIISALEAQYSKGKNGIKAFKGQNGLKAVAEIISFSSTPEIIIINPDKNPIGPKALDAALQEIKKRLGKVAVEEIGSKFGGCLVIFDKVIFFPADKSEALLIS